MTDQPMTKKMRIWNPAVSDNTAEMDSPTQQDEDGCDEKPLDFSKPAPFPFQDIFQNYLQIAPLMIRAQQQEMARRQFLNAALAAPRMIFNHGSQALPCPPKIMMDVPIVSSPNISEASTSTPTTTSTANIVNPIVATALGNPLINENCCAVCGAAFRLTGDLVQHMRNNHRKNKFKRKADLRH